MLKNQKRTAVPPTAKPGAATASNPNAPSRNVGVSHRLDTAKAVPAPSANAADCPAISVARPRPSSQIAAATPAAKAAAVP